MTPQVAILLGMVSDFITDPFSWLGFVALIVSKSTEGVRYRNLLM